MVSIRDTRPSSPWFDSQEIVYVAEINQWRCSEESGQWLENVDQTHLVLASGKLVLQKTLDPDIHLFVAGGVFASSVGPDL